MRSNKGLAKGVRKNGAGMHLGSFPYILLLLGRRISFVTSIPASSLVLHRARYVGVPM